LGSGDISARAADAPIAALRGSGAPELRQCDLHVTDCLLAQAAACFADSSANAGRSFDPMSG